MSCFSLSEIDDSNEESEPDESSKQDARTKLGTPNELIPRNVSNHPDDSNILPTTSNTRQDNEPEAQDISNSDSEGGKYNFVLFFVYLQACVSLKTSHTGFQFTRFLWLTHKRQNVFAFFFLILC
jgi:hypothetical protein